MSKSGYTTQNDLLLTNLLAWYNSNNNLNQMLEIINGESPISLRIVDWFATNYAKKDFTVYDINKNGVSKRFKVYIDYKLKLKAYSKKRFDPFCRWDRITIPYHDDVYIQTTIGQLNFFKWALEYKIIDFIREYLDHIEADMNNRNSSAKYRSHKNNKKTRKKRQELSVSATKSIKKEDVVITVRFD